MNLEDLRAGAKSSEEMASDVKMQEIVLPLLGMIFMMGSSKDSIVSALTISYIKGRERGIEDAGYKADGEEAQ